MKTAIYLLFLLFGYTFFFIACDNRELAQPVIQYNVAFKNATGLNSTTSTGSGAYLNQPYATNLQIQVDSGIKNTDTYTLTATVTKGTVNNLQINNTQYKPGMTAQATNSVNFTPESAGPLQIVFDITNNHGVSHYDTLNVTVTEINFQFSVSDSNVVDTAVLNKATTFNYYLFINSSQTGSDTAKFKLEALINSGAGSLSVNNVSYSADMTISVGKNAISFIPSDTGKTSITLTTLNSAGMTKSVIVTFEVVKFKNVPFIVTSSIGQMFWHPGTAHPKSVIRPTDTIPVNFTVTSGNPSMTYTVSLTSGSGALTEGSSYQQITGTASIPEGSSTFYLIITNLATGSETATFTITDLNGISHTTSITYTVTKNISPTVTSGLLLNGMGSFVGFKSDNFNYDPCYSGSTPDVNTYPGWPQTWKNYASYNAILTLQSNAADQDGYLAYYTITGYNSYILNTIHAPDSIAYFSFKNYNFNASFLNTGSTNPIEILKTGLAANCTNCPWNQYLDFYTYDGNWDDVEVCEEWLTIVPQTQQCILTVYDNEGAASAQLIIYSNTDAVFKAFASNPSNF